MSSLKERFEHFILSVEGVESVDQLLTGRDIAGRQRADYLAVGRSVIVEQKSLDIDPDHKVPKFFEKHTSADGVVIDGDLTSLSHTLRRFPGGTKLGINLYQSLTKGLDDILSKADKQTRDTRIIFHIPDAIGVVVILNDSAQTLEPDVVAIKAFEMVRKVNPAGITRYPENHVVILISEAHRIRSDKPADFIPTATVYSEAGNQNPLVTSFAEHLLRGWAEFNQASYMDDPDLWRDFKTRDEAKIFHVRVPKSSI